MTDSPSTVVKISGPADILGLLPYRLGFHPTESIVVACLHGARRRAGLVMRLDLMPEGADDDVAADLAERAAHVGATGAIVVCYTDEDTEPVDADEAPDGARRTLPRRPLIEALTRRLAGDGIVVVESLLVRKGRWWSYDCCDESCCSAAGTELPQVLTPAAAHYAAASVLEGASVLPDRDQLARSIRPPRNPVADQARRQALDRAADREVALLPEGGLADAATRTVGLLRELLARWSDGVCGLSLDEAATVVVGLHVKAARDEAVTLALESQPETLLALLVALARHADAPDAAPICTVVAWVACLRGHGALANVAVERALSCDPDYELALLIAQGLERMMRPREVRRLTRLVRDRLRRQAATKPGAAEGRTRRQIG